MALTISDVLMPATVAEWEARIIAWAAALGLSATAWQPGGVARTIVAVMANAMQQTDVVASGIAAGGWLDTASGITPEGGPGWLDLVARYTYGVTRTQATYGTSTVVLTNAGGAVGPLAAGTYHLRAPGGNTYTNSAAITIGVGSTTIAVVCDQAAQVDVPTSSMVPITSFSGVASGALVTAAVGASAESNPSLVARCRAKMSAIGQHGAGAAYQYFALSSDLAGYPPLSSTITRCSVTADTYSGAVSVVVANASGAVAGGDVALLQTYLDGAAVPDGESMAVLSAASYAVTTTMLVWCPTAYQTRVVTDVQNSAAAFIASLPIGGERVEDPALSGVSFNALEDCVARAVPYLRTQSTTLNGSASSVILTNVQVATSASVVVTYMGA